MNFETPKEVRAAGALLKKNGHKAFLVGGCVRDLLLKKEPKDWDIATDATPEEIQNIFPESVYENEFGTVGVKTDAKDERVKIIEITTFRKEGTYTDKRHPDEVVFSKNIEEDLGRRDFTMNAIALDLFHETDHEIIDPYDGQKDLKKKIIVAVGDPEKRFDEDALRLLRAIRFASELSFDIEEKTLQAVKEKAGLIEFVSKERIRDEITKLIMGDNAYNAMCILQEFDLLKHIFPELEEGIDVGQNKHHIYTVFEHNMKAFEYAVKKKYSLIVRVASLLHDVGKPKTKRGNGPNSTFYGHQVVGERMVLKMLDRLRFSKEFTERVALLVREHMFIYDPDTVTLSGVRRLIRRVGKENIEDLIKVREADRIGSGVPKAQPYRLRYLQAMIEKVQKDPIHPKMLKLNGEDIVALLKIEPGPRIGFILAILLEEVLDDPEKNKKVYLKKRVKELAKESDAELKDKAQSAKKKADKAQENIDKEIKNKYFVK